MSNDDCEIIYSQSNLESIKADYEKQLAFAKKQLDEAKAYCAKKDQQVSELQIRVDRLTLELEDKKDEFALINKRNKEAMDQQSNFKEKNEKSEKELHNAYLELTQLQDRNLSLGQENKKLIELVATQKKELEKGNETIKKLNSDMACLKAEFNKKPGIFPIKQMPVQPPPPQKSKADEILVTVQKSLKNLHEAIKRLTDEIESRLEVMKFFETNKHTENLKKMYEADMIEVRDRLKEVLFFKDIAEGAMP